ncbi:MAG TPA: hypothetical protein VHR47_03660 [Bacillota bacterium]|nr:hypothetical protein [Bacillota bacterium]
MRARSFHPYVWLIVFSIVLSSLVSVEATSANTVIRDDGLTVVNVSSEDCKEPVQYLTLLIKTGSASDPIGKAGLMECTNELLGYVFRGSTAASQIYRYTGQDFSYFQFTIARSNLKSFMEQLDERLRSDVILAYDFSNWLLYQRKAKPVNPAKPAYLNFSAMLYGTNHPYILQLNPDYNNLNINEINKWFRRVYRPNNFIISSSFKIPEDFLRQPVGKEFKAPVGLPDIPSPHCERKPAIRYVKIHDNCSTVLMGFSGPKIDDEEYFAFRLGTLYLETELTE